MCSLTSATRPGHKKNKKCFRAPLRLSSVVFGGKKALKNCKLQLSRSGRPLGGPVGNPYRWPGSSLFQRARAKRTGNEKSLGAAVEPLGVNLIFPPFSPRRRSRWQKKYFPVWVCSGCPRLLLQMGQLWVETTPRDPPVTSNNVQ